jgi:cell division protein FtsQ
VKEMNISKDGRTLYFSDEEIDNETNGEKKVFVTKRINGKESHIKAEKTNLKKRKKQEVDNKEETFNFNNEIVIGVNVVEDKEKEKQNKRKNKSKKINKNNSESIKEKIKKSKNKKKKSKKKIFVFLSSIALIGIVVIFALTAPIFNITNIQIEGNEKIEAQAILSLSGLKKGENIFRFNNSVIQNIKENSYIESVEVKRKLPGTVLISIKERDIKYQINLINSYTYIDKNGYILENSTIKKEVPVLVGLEIKEDEMLSKERLKTEDLEKLNKTSKIMEAAKAINIENIITEINTENENEYIIYIESKSKKIYIGDTTNLTNKMLYVQRILENEEGKSGSAFVNGDIRSGFKPYFREE